MVPAVRMRESTQKARWQISILTGKNWKKMEKTVKMERMYQT